MFCIKKILTLRMALFEYHILLKRIILNAFSFTCH